MGILGINNRTENWKTVRTLCPPLTRDAKVKLVQRLLAPYPNALQVAPTTEVNFELFWKGARDKANDCKKTLSADRCKDAYQGLFGDLRGKIATFICEDKPTSGGKFSALKDWNYKVGDDILVDGNATPSSEELKSNLLYTEIDIVLETPNHLFIGEAKDESDFDAKSKYILVHQLIRQYVMAKLLVKVMQKPRHVVPFIVVSNVEKIRNLAQVRFMIREGWLKERNVLSWDCIKSVLEPSESASYRR